MEAAKITTTTTATTTKMDNLCLNNWQQTTAATNYPHNHTCSETCAQRKEMATEAVNDLYKEFVRATGDVAPKREANNNNTTNNKNNTNIPKPTNNNNTQPTPTNDKEQTIK